MMPALFWKVHSVPPPLTSNTHHRSSKSKEHSKDILGAYFVKSTKRGQTPKENTRGGKFGLEDTDLTLEHKILCLL